MLGRILWSRKAAPMLIFENDQIAVHFQDGLNDDLICTFAHFDFGAASGFWGQYPLSNLGYSSIGVVCKGNNWYPSRAMSDVKYAVSGILERFTRRLTYGFSMGGFGALKYSGMFNATHVLALSPQWSIDPADTYNFDPKWAPYFSEDYNNGMAIKHEDISGKVVCIYDGTIKSDTAHATAIARACTTYHGISMPGLGHETIDVFASTDTLGNVIRSVLSDDLSNLRKTCSLKRREADRRLINVINRAIERRPSAGKILFDRHHENIPSYFRHLLADRPIG